MIQEACQLVSAQSLTINSAIASNHTYKTFCPFMLYLQMFQFICEFKHCRGVPIKTFKF